MENIDFAPIVQVALQAVAAILGILGAIALRHLRNYLLVLDSEARLRIGTQEFDFVVQATARLVRAAAQTHGLATGPQRKAFVLDQLHSLSGQMGIELPTHQLEAIIEGVYRELKDELNNGPVLPPSWELTETVAPILSATVPDQQNG